MRWDIAAAALTYSRRGWPVFPCRVENGNKRPLVKEWQRVASADEQQIREWWPRRFPHAAIGVPTGHGCVRFVVLGIDVKRAQDNGFDTLAELGHAVLPDTPMVHTPSGGLHLYFDPGDRLIRNTAGKKGRGLDVRGDGGFVVVPGPGSGYRWDPVYKIDHLPLALAPDWLVAPEPDHQTYAAPIGGRRARGNGACGRRRVRRLRRAFCRSRSTAAVTIAPTR
jgi:putative DNA primase/helicase